MDNAIYGALIGVGVAVFLVAAEYFFVQKAASERAKRMHLKSTEFDPTERKRIASVARFSVLLPLLFAFLFWIVGD
jgi:L-rhamnose isomerase